MYTQNKYNIAICKYVAVALGAVATTVLMVWPLAWSRDSILFYDSHHSTVHCVTIYYSNAGYIYGPRCQLLTCKNTVKGDNLPYTLDRYMGSIIMVLDELQCGRDRICLGVDQERVKWRAFVNTVMNIKVYLILPRGAVQREGSKRFWYSFYAFVFIVI